MLASMESQDVSCTIIRIPKGVALFVAMALILGAGGLMFVDWREADAVTRIPPPPTTAAQSNAVAAHLGGKYEAARREPTSAAAIGSLCVAYHADMFFDEADRCYLHP